MRPSFLGRERGILAAVGAICLFPVAGCVSLAPHTGGTQKIIAMDGVPGLYKVDDNLYCGGQPTVEGFHNLRAMGIRTIVNLRTQHDDKPEVGQVEGLQLVPLPISAWSRDLDEPVLKFLRVMKNHEGGAVYVHCIYGGDRCGALSAAYRVVLQNWSKDDAIREMTQSQAQYHEFWTNMPNYIRDMDANAMRVRLGLPPEPGYVFFDKPIKPYKPVHWFGGAIRWGLHQLFHNDPDPIGP